MRKLYWQWLAGFCVLGIIAVVVLPIFSRARESGRPNPDARCRINLKNITLGLKQYIQDNDEKYPPAASSGANYAFLDGHVKWIKATEVLSPARRTTMDIK